MAARTFLALFGATLIAVAAICSPQLATLVFAAPPPGTAPDTALAEWFQSLHVPGTNLSCCAQYDGRVTDLRQTADGYEAWIGPQFGPAASLVWEPVPKAAVLDRVDNPLGRPVVFWRKGMGIRCVVRSPET